MSTANRQGHSPSKEINSQRNPLLAGQSCVCFASESNERDSDLSASSAQRQLKVFNLILKYKQLLSQHESGQHLGVFFNVSALLRNGREICD